MNVPEELKYSNDHEWIRVDGDNATIGITDFAQSQLGDIVYVEVESVDESLGQGEIFGTIEAVKTVTDLKLPVDAEIIEFNKNLEDNPDVINSDPYGEGWIIKVKIKEQPQLENLLTANEYSEFIMD
jgi:glycine cleavage system H protein